MLGREGIQGVSSNFLAQGCELYQDLKVSSYKEANS